MKESTRRTVLRVCERFSMLNDCSDTLIRATEAMAACYAQGGKVLACGNGGSAADAQHIVGELMKGFVLPRKIPGEHRTTIEAVSPEMSSYICENLQGALPTMSLVAETALSTAYANDMAPDLAFAQQVYGHGKKGDILLGISTSGNSKNVIYASVVAKAFGMKVISLTGAKGGALRELSDILINVPSNETYQIQELHLPVYHALCLALENEFFGE